ncbi:MAG: NUDIX domain-containing protein [Proteobacteria bacterium]|nr:NUDIX domain-containing protein [Pseudomonadota bacterium]
MSQEHLPYRESVVGVFVAHDEVLVLERFDTPGAWQFPQGGIESGESAEQALVREMQEELGCGEFQILQSSADMIYYDFPTTLIAPISKMFRGQKSRWYLCAFGEPFEVMGVDLSRATDREFADFRWVKPYEAYEHTIYWKKDAYRKGLKDLGLVDV